MEAYHPEGWNRARVDKCGTGFAPNITAFSAGLGLPRPARKSAREIDGLAGQWLPAWQILVG